MAHIVYISVGMASMLFTGIELARRLRTAGHRITFVSHRDIAAQVTASGFEFVRLVGQQEFHARAGDDPLPQRALLRPASLLRWIRRRRRLRRESIDCREIEGLLRRLQPDLLLVDMECHFALIASAGLGIPTVLLMVWFSVFRRPGLPPLHTSRLPGENWQQEIGNRIAWSLTRVAAVVRVLRQSYGLQGIRAALRPVSYGTVRYPDLAALAKSRGYELRRQTDRSQWLRPFVYRDIPILCLNAWEMEFPHDAPDRVHYVGPMTDGVRAEPGLVGATAARWQAYRRTRSRQKTDRRPLVYCSLGSYWAADLDFLRRVIAVFAHRTEWDLVLGLGGKAPSAALDPVPPNVLLLDWAPQMEALSLADCAITHGGVTTINECLRCNVPMVVYSTKHVDQNGCAARVAYLGLGVMADKDRDDPQQIERNIERCLSDPDMHDKVARMQQVFEGYERSNQALRLIEALVASRRRT